MYYNVTKEMHHINHLLMWTVLTVYQLFICTYQTCVENGSLLCLVYIYSCLSMIPDHYYDYHEYCKMMMRWLFKCWIKNLFYIFLFFKWLKGFQNFSVVINIDLCKNKVFLNYLKIAKFCSSSVVSTHFFWKQHKMTLFCYLYI